MENLGIWNEVRTPNPKYTKEFNRDGGFKGTATNTQYIIQRATELWGPNGYGWGLEITGESYVDGHWIDERNREVIHVIRGRVWYMVDTEKYFTAEQFGQTTFIGKNKYGAFTDEEAPKKSVTDMMLKCLSLLGFSADIFLGLWDDNKYVNDARKMFEEKNAPASNSSTKPPQGKPPYAPTNENVTNGATGALNGNSAHDAEWYMNTVGKECKNEAELTAWWHDNEAEIGKLSKADQGKVVATCAEWKAVFLGLAVVCPESQKIMKISECEGSKCREGCPAHKEA